MIGGEEFELGSDQSDAEVAERFTVQSTSSGAADLTIEENGDLTFTTVGCAGKIDASGHLTVGAGGVSASSAAAMSALRGIIINLLRSKAELERRDANAEDALVRIREILEERGC